MVKITLFEGKTTMASKDVDLKIFKNVEGDGSFYYSWDYNPYLIDKSQMDVHRGGIMLGKNLEELLYRINTYKGEIRDIKKVINNTNF